jgi:hypothetical protein
MIGERIEGSNKEMEVSEEQGRKKGNQWKTRGTGEVNV